MNSPTLRLSGLDTWQHFQQIFTVKVPLIDDLRIMSEESQADEIAKYKRVLSLARSSLEANQSTIAAKDQQIAQLIKALEEEKSNNKAKRVLAKEEEAALVPRKILCRVDVEDFIWILIEYEEFDDAWKRMQDEQDLEDFIQRVPGVPLICPAKCLSSDESRKIMDDSKQRVERIVEEFRRYKVRTEIAKKQKDAEARQAVINGTTLSSGSTIPANYSNNLTPFERALTLNSGDHVQTHGDGAAEIARLRETLAEQETKWKKLYESVAKENEVLRSKGGESLLATQWRGRYEACMKEKEELTDKLELYNAWTSQVNASGKSMDQAYIEVQEQFLAFRKKIAAIDRRRQRNTASMLLNSSSGAAGEAGSGDLLIHPTAGHPIESDLSVLLREYEQQSSRASYSSSSLGSPRHAGSTGNGHGSNSSAYRSGGGTIASLEDDNTGADGSTGMTASKIKYVRHMVLQYLSCREPEVRAHIETALMAIFRLSPAEREVVESKRREETTDALSSISSFLGSLGT